MLNIIGIVMLAVASQGSDNEFTEVRLQAEACSQEYKLALKQGSLPGINYVEIRKLRKTTSIGFMEGNPGPLGEPDRQFDIHFVCTVDNATGEIIYLAEPFKRTFVDKEISEQSEYEEHYVGNDKAYFDLLLFSYGDGNGIRQ